MELKEQENKPYIVISHVSDNTGTRADGEKVEKQRVATKLIATSPEHALKLSKAHHEKSGRKVHSANIKEEVELTIEEQLNEVLSKDADAGDWISDFIKSDNPKFAGKSKAERTKMALGAYYAKQKNEDISIDEKTVCTSDMEKNKAINSKDKETLGKLSALMNKEKKPMKEELLGFEEFNESRAHKMLATKLGNMERMKTHGTEPEKKDLPFEPDAPKKNPSATAGKYGQGYSTARHLARQGVKSVSEEQTITEEHHEYSISHYEVTDKNADAVRSVIAKHGAKHTGTSDKDTSFSVHKDKSDAFKRDLKSHGVYADRMNEEVEELDELSKKTLGSYVKQASDDMADKKQFAQAAHMRGDETERHGLGDAEMRKSFAKHDYDRSKKLMDKAVKRRTGINTAVNKLAKEDTMLTYAEFMEKLEEAKIDDLRDKQAADREARKNAYDFSKEKDVKPSSSTKVKGRSYGAGEDNDDDEEKPLEKPSAEKRGRGRPAGAKSGARTKGAGSSDYRGIAHHSLSLPNKK